MPGAAAAAANWAEPAPEDAPTVEFKAYNMAPDGRPAPRVVALGGGQQVINVSVAVAPAGG